MFKKFTREENISGQALAKSSVARGIRSAILEQYPVLEDAIDDIWPKKAQVHIVKCHDKITLVQVNDTMLFFNQHDGPWFPTLRLLHKYPNMLPHQTVDKGAIKFVLSGAHIMCPGLTHPNATLIDANVDDIVAIMAEGKQHALAIGQMKMSADDIRKLNKGIGVNSIHYLNDGLWTMEA